MRSCKINKIKKKIYFNFTPKIILPIQFTPAPVFTNLTSSTEVAGSRENYNLRYTKIMMESL